MSVKNSIGNRTRYFLVLTQYLNQLRHQQRVSSFWYFHILPYRHFLFIFIRMFVLIELVNDKLFGLVYAECRLLGCNITAETERRETRWSLSAHFVGFNFGSHRVKISVLEVDVVCVVLTRNKLILYKFTAAIIWNPNL
jgi:hypothetical protein